MTIRLAPTLDEEIRAASDARISVPELRQRRAEADMRAVDQAQPATERQDEKAFMAEVIKYAKSQGWKHYHTTDSRKSVAGFPDCVFVRERVIFAELKTAAGKLTAAQSGWIDDLKAAGQDAYVFRPENWPQIVELLAAVERPGQRRTEIQLTDM